MCGKIIEFVSDLFLCLWNTAFHFLFIVVFFQRSRMCLLQKLLPLFATCLEPISKYRIFLCNNLNESTINFCLKFCFGLIPIIQYHFFFEFWICVLYFLNVRKQQIVIYYFCLDWMQFGFGKVNLTIAAWFHSEWAAFFLLVSFDVFSKYFD